MDNNLEKIVWKKGAFHRVSDGSRVKSHIACGNPISDWSYCSCIGADNLNDPYWCKIELELAHEGARKQRITSKVNAYSATETVQGPVENPFTAIAIQLYRI